MKVYLSGSFCFFAALILCLPQSLPAESGKRTQGLIDSIDIAVSSGPLSESAHGVTTAGDTVRIVRGGRVGGHDVTRMARVARGMGSWVSYRVKAAPEEPITLEVEEMDGRESNVRGYLVQANGVDVCLRTWQGCGAGALHYFVQIPPSSSDSILIRFVNQLDAPFSISRIWVFSNFDAYFAHSQMDEPYYLAPTVRLDYRDRAEDAAKLLQIKRTIGAGSIARPAWTTWVPYALLSQSEVNREIDYILGLASEVQLPVQISFDTWWGDTPDGSDGKGGFWSDVRYQQAVYNATTGRYQLSVPNQWSNTPWLTVNSSALNRYKRHRLKAAIVHLRRRYREMLAAGKEKLLFALSLDNEPVYWASGDAGLGGDLLLADFNPRTVEAARADGVKLDPSNGLNPAQRLWLFNNLLRYNTMISNTMSAALGRDFTLVDGSASHPSDDLLRNNIYTQGMVATPKMQYPMLSAVYPLWETAAPARARVGGEWNGDSLPEREAVLHQIALGRCANTNAECGEDENAVSGVGPGYALGQRFYTLYNYPLDKMNVAEAQVASKNKRFATFQYQPELMKTDFGSENWQRQLSSYSGLQRGLIGNTAAEAIFPASNKLPGYLLYKLTAPLHPFDLGVFRTGLTLEWSGRAFVFQKQDSRVCIQVFAGPKLGDLKEISRTCNDGDINAVHRVDLSAAAHGQHSVYVQIELSGEGLPPSVMSWCALTQLRFTLPWPASLIRRIASSSETLASARSENLLVSWRQDAELAMESLARRAAKEKPSRAATPLMSSSQTVAARLAIARKSYSRGDYAGAYAIANRALCVSLPAVFCLKTSGWLSPYRIRIETSQPVTCKLLSFTGAKLQVSLKNVASPGHVNLMLEGLPIRTPYSIILTDSGGVKQKVTLRTGLEGAVTWSVNLRAAACHIADQPVEGSFAGSSAGGLIVFPDDGGGSEDIHTNAHTIFMRGIAGDPPAPSVLTDFRRGDEVYAVTGADGIASRVTATFQETSGIVTGSGPLSPFTMPWLRIKGESSRRIIDLKARLHLPEGLRTMISYPPGVVKIMTGASVRLRTNPKTGRIFELWERSGY